MLCSEFKMEFVNFQIAEFKMEFVNFQIAEFPKKYIANIKDIHGKIKQIKFGDQSYQQYKDKIGFYVEIMRYAG